MSEVKGLLSWIALATILAAGCVSPETSGSASFIRWASDRVIACERPGSALPPDELARFREALGSARVVGIGESRHDTREQTLMKGVLVRHLIEDLGFRVLILEESFPHAEALDRYVTRGEGDLRRILSGLAGWYLWDTEEMLETVLWVRSFNASREADRMVRIFGMDVTAPAPGVREVLDTLRAAGIEGVPDASALGLDLQEGDLWPATWERYGALSDERREELGRNYASLIATVEAETERRVPASSNDAFERALMLSRIGDAGNDLFSSPTREAGGEFRERGMTQVVNWILDREKDARAIVWAHNLHVAKAPFRMPGFAEGELTPMGLYLAEALGDAYLAIGASFGSGSYPASLPPGERSFEVPPAEVMDGALARVGHTCFLLDLRDAEQDPAVARWLGEAREWRAQEVNSVIVPSAAFDLVFHVSEVSRAQPTPAAMQR